MTKVTFKERRFTSAFVEECKAQDQSPESDCDRAPTIEGVLACPESRRPRKTKARGQTPYMVHVDPIAYFANPEVVLVANPAAVQRGDREPKRVTQNQLRGLNANAVHIDEEGFLKDGPKKVKGFDQLRDLLGKN